MLDFFDWIVDTFEYFFHILENMLKGLLTLFEVLVTIQMVPSRIYGYLPSFLSASVLIISAVGIAKLCVGWGNK